MKNRLISSIDTTKDLSDEELDRMILNMAAEGFCGSDVPVNDRLRTIRDLHNSVRGLDILEEILADDEITEIMVNGPDNIFIEKAGVLSRYDGAFTSEQRLSDIIQTIAGQANKRVNESSPIVDTRLEDGSRINIVLPPVAVTGPKLTIRKFPKDAITLETLVRIGSITEEAAAFLKDLTVCGYNIFISGGTGSGKTTFLNALAGCIPPDERIITIEDSAELQIRNIPNLVSLECRPANTEGENEVSIRDLIRASLRMRPTRIIVGEVRGAESFDMLQAMNTGHDGSLSTGHANSPQDMLTRLEMMVLMAAEMPVRAIRNQIASALDIMVHLGRLPDGSRRVLEIDEVEDIKRDRITLKPLFVYDSYEDLLINSGCHLKNTRKLAAGGSRHAKRIS